MPQSLVKNYIHIIFSTKHRQPFIIPEVENDLHAYLGGILKARECRPIKIGGYLDHVHILCLLSQKVALMDLMEEMKAHSSKWMKTLGTSFENFYWQNGYGAFSVSASKVEVVSRYIETQAEHHREHTFQGEYRGFLKKYKVDYDERYVWD